MQSTLSSSTTTTTTDAAAATEEETSSRLQSILVEIAKQLVTQGATGLKASAVALKEASASKPQLVMNVLVPFLFQKEEENIGEKNDDNRLVLKHGVLSASTALSVLTFLVTSDESAYLKPASRAVKTTVILHSNSMDTGNDDNFAVSHDLLFTMVAQLVGSHDVETSTNATDAIVASCRKLGRPLIEAAMQAIVEAWKNALTNNKSNRAAASTACVRCAATVAEMICALDDAITMKCAIASGAMDLFVTMLQDDSDPLVQMSMLDLVEKMASTTSSSSSICITHCHHRATWLLTPPGVVEPVLKMAGGMSDQDDCEPDAILGGSALRIVAALCKLAHYRREPDDEMVNVGQEFMMTTTTVEGGGGGTLNLVACFHRALHKFAVTASGELDRLALIDAISSFAAASASAMDLVLNDEVTKQAWLSLAVAQPHLKSAILISVAMVLDPSRSMLVDATNDDVDSLLRRRPDRASAMKLYSSLGQVNHDQDPTSLLLSMTRSTLVETRLAAYAMFTAMAKLPDGAGCQVLFSHASFLDFCLTRRDNDIERMSQDGREGKFAIVQAIAQNQVIMGLLAPEIVARIELYIKQGPHHFQAARSWELATDQ